MGMTFLVRLINGSVTVSCTELFYTSPPQASANRLAEKDNPMSSEVGVVLVPEPSSVMEKERFIALNQEENNL